MLHEFSQFLTDHTSAGWFFLLVLLIVIGKAERLLDRAIDARSDSEREYRRERRERIEGRAT